MAKAFSIASWNVEHFKGNPARTNRVISFLRQQNPDVIGLYEVEGSAVFTEVTSQFPSYTFQITEGPQSQEILDEALNSGDLFRIGIAIHSYADTWSHQYFMGCEHNVNSWPVNPIDLGHAFYGHKPDIVNKIWSDNRLQSDEDINNLKRF